MKYLLVINNNERLDNGEEDTLDSVADDVEELLRMGYFEVESIKEIAE